jgi:spermidine synthase
MPQPLPIRPKVLLVYTLFCVSGFTGLIYEVLWLRMIERITGSSPVAVSLLLSTYMAGLALGAHLGGLLSDRARQKTKLLGTYGTLEAFVALWAILIPLFAFVWSPFYRFCII